MSSGSDAADHPATYSDEILECFQGIVPAGSRVLDPFAGTGWRLAEALGDCTIVGIEIEPEWAASHPCIRQGDATDLPFSDDEFKWAATSPSYGNRMADSHNAQEKCKACGGTGRADDDTECGKCNGLGRRRYKRITYTHYLGRKLNPNNSGAMQWGKKYREFHVTAWTELARVLDGSDPSSPAQFLLNISDHYRAGKIVPVTDWHVETLESLGFKEVARHPIPTKRMRFGANSDLRVDNEWVIHFEYVNP